MEGIHEEQGKAPRMEKSGKPAEAGPALHASWLPRLQEAIDAAEKARARADESAQRSLQAQRQARSDAATLATAQEKLIRVCTELCAAGGALAANGIPAGLTPLTPVAAAPAQPGRRGGRGQNAHAAPAERGASSAEPPADNGEAKPVVPGTVLWVGGMEKGTSEDAIRRAFTDWGVEAVRLPDGGDAVTKGFAFLTFATPGKAHAAQEAMDGATIVDGGKPIAVQVSRNPSDGRPEGGTRRRARGGRSRARGGSSGVDGNRGNPSPGNQPTGALRDAASSSDGSVEHGRGGANGGI